MGFKVGDRVKRVSSSSRYRKGIKIGAIGTLKGYYSSDSDYVAVEWDICPGCSDNSTCEGMCSESNGGWMEVCDLALYQGNSILENKMEKKIFKVLIIDKKTGKTIKNENVIAEDEQQALLKTFNVDAENTFIKIKEEGKFETKEPVNAILIKEDKK